MKNFVLIGAAGFVAPRHLKAIKETGNNLVAALDKHDAVGVLDNYFPDAAFFTEFERFDRHLDKLKRSGTHLDFVSVCSPNYLHDAHIRFGLRLGADIVCEKPVTLNPWNIEGLQEMEKETQHKVYSILQLRHHPVFIALKQKLDAEPIGPKHEVSMTYITARGKWYFTSWKGDTSKSGGISTNIGVHFFDILAWLFGEVQQNEVHLNTHDRASGYLQLERANIKWFLSINAANLPATVRESGGRTYRSLELDGQAIEFSDGFTDLHTLSYQNILNGGGFSLGEAKKAIEVVHAIRNTVPIGVQAHSHELANLPLSPHPFG
ncbi:MAG: Gfo/Idh/MocA family oxidoreductase [Saprospiraceae bacterium]|nr:Gfo/Idh/MocA family oxidoreductase [Saprospiraceae bacterium]